MKSPSTKRQTAMRPELKTSVKHQKIVAVIKMIPRGCVASYGQVAKLAGYPGHARQVVWTLHSSSRAYRLPWHRVVNARGEIAISDQRAKLGQRSLLIREGVHLNEHGRINLADFLWRPNAANLKNALNLKLKTKKQ